MLDEDGRVLPNHPAGPFALFLDVDGTLLEIADRPEQVVVGDDLRTTLRRLDVALGGAVALLSGRTVAELDRLFAPLQLRAGGVHGAELRFTPGGLLETASEGPLSDAIIGRLDDIVRAVPGSFVENKGYSAAVHFRAAPTGGPLLQRRLEALLAEPVGQGCSLLPGHMVFEVKRTGFDKGIALGRFLTHAPFRGRKPVFIGDDITDIPACAEAQARGGLAFSVTTPRPGFSDHFENPADVRRWLATLRPDPLPSTIAM